MLTGFGPLVNDIKGLDQVYFKPYLNQIFLDLDICSDLNGERFIISESVICHPNSIQN